MRKTWMTIFVLLISVLFVTAVMAQEKAKAKPEKAAAPEKASQAEAPAKPELKSYVGEVTEVKAAKKQLVVTVKMAGDVLIQEKNLIFNEATVAEEAINFDVSKAKITGCKAMKNIKKGDAVRVVYEKKGDTFLAKEVQKLKKETKKKK